MDSLFHTKGESTNSLNNIQIKTKYLILAILNLDANPAFKSEVAAWLDSGNLVNIYAYIHPEEEVWMSQLFKLLNSKTNASLISSLEIKGPDQGINGTRLYDLAPLLIDQDIKFTNLKEFEVEQTSILHNNISMVSFNDFYEDNGAGGRILDKMPNLTSLTLPCAPNPSFFKKNKEHPLFHLSLQAGFEHQGFISRLANSTSFPNLKHFEWSDGPGKPKFTSCVPQKQLNQLKNSSNFKFHSLQINSFQSLWNRNTNP